MAADTEIASDRYAALFTTLLRVLRHHIIVELSEDDWIIRSSSGNWVRAFSPPSRNSISVDLEITLNNPDRLDAWTVKVKVSPDPVGLEDLVEESSIETRPEEVSDLATKLAEQLRSTVIRRYEYAQHPADN